jgi:hypothetical protein
MQTLREKGSVEMNSKSQTSKKRALELRRQEKRARKEAKRQARNTQQTASERSVFRYDRTLAYAPDLRD